MNFYYLLINFYNGASWCLHRDHNEARGQFGECCHLGEGSQQLLPGAEALWYKTGLGWDGGCEMLDWEEIGRGQVIAPILQTFL